MVVVAEWPCLHGNTMRIKFELYEPMVIGARILSLTNVLTVAGQTVYWNREYPLDVASIYNTPMAG